MAHTASAKKRLRQGTKRNLKNRSVKHAIKTQVRRLSEAVEAKDSTKAQTELSLANKRLDKAVARGILHKNTASRTKSRLATQVAALQKAGK